MPDSALRFRLRNETGSAPARRLALIPSWLVSFVLHGALLAALWATLPGLRGGIVGDPDGDFRKIGIYVGKSGDGGNGASAAIAGKKPSSPAIPAASINSGLRPASPRVGESTASVSRPARPDKAQSAVPVLGPGGRGAEQAVAGAANTGAPKSAGPSHASGLGGTGLRGSRGNNSFFGIWDGGAKFVYLIDCSGSMYGHHAMQAAKNELIASLATLKKSQQFQIVFYNSELRWLKTPGNTDGRYFSARDDVRREALRFIAEIQPDLGTDHMPALRMALRLRPDVIFFLTDAGDPGLSSFDLEEIRKLNNGQSRIHCVEFRSPDEPRTKPGPSFMQTLAAENGGDYVFRDVSSFDRHP